MAYYPVSRARQIERQRRERRAADISQRRLLQGLCPQCAEELENEDNGASWCPQCGDWYTRSEETLQHA